MNPLIPLIRFALLSHSYFGPLFIHVYLRTYAFYNHY